MTYEENVRAILESNFAGFKEEVIDTACKMILGLRTYVEWIPCSEQLPKEDDTTQVLVSVNERYAFYKIILLPSRSVKTEYRLGHIDAWMELPKPYEEEEIPKDYANKLTPVGFSQHDCESHYECPFCGEDYGSWSIPINKPFKCMCGRYVWTD